MNTHSMSDIDMHIKSWIEHVSQPQEKLDNLPVCPFAKKVEYKLIDTNLDQLGMPNHDLKLIIYILPDEVSEQQMADRCLALNKQYPDYVFLPDHKNKRTYINNILTNNCKYNLVMCQPKEEIEKSRESLLKTNYYTFFNNKYWNQECVYESIVPNNHWSKTVEPAT